MSWFDAVIVITCIISLIRGFISGFVKQIASLLGIIAGLLFAGKVSLKIKPHLHQLTSDTPDHILNILSYIVAFAIILVIFALIGLTIRKMLKLIQLGLIDHVAGSVFCAAKHLIILSILLNIILTFDLNQRIIKPELKENSIFYPHIKSIASYFIPFLDFDKQKGS